MSAITKTLKLSKLSLKNPPVLYSIVRNHWNKDYKAGPYPKTEDERVAAAQKYGLLPSEYEVYPDDGTGFGDYPKVPLVSGDARDPYYPWDNPELKRNFNEPLHIEEDMYGEDRYDISHVPIIPGHVQVLQFLGVMIGSYIVYYLLENVKFFSGKTEKQFPGDGKVHYTFEPK